MPPATTGTYRVLQVADDRYLLADRDDAYEPVAVTPGDDIEADLEPGNVVEADVAFGAEQARLLDVTVLRPTVFEFVPDASVVFEAAEDAWNRAQAAGEGVGSQVTRDTDGAVNGVLYVFADTPAGDRIEEFRTGRRPLDPLLERVAETEGQAPRDMFVVSPEEPFVVVTIALDPDGLLARAMRETYDLPGAGEFDVAEHTDSGGAVPDLPDGLGQDAIEGSTPDGTVPEDDGVGTDELGGVGVLGHDAGESSDDEASDQ